MDLATETRIGFSNWGKMVGELHACVEKQQGGASVSQETTDRDQYLAKIERNFSSKSAELTKDSVVAMGKQFESAEKCLGMDVELSEQRFC